MSELPHFDDRGSSRMIDTGEKPETQRSARACAEVLMSPDTLRLIRDRGFRKGDVCEVARLAGIMAAKQTSNLIPLCHPLPLTAIAIGFRFIDETTLEIEATVGVVARTGVEMEALTAVSVAALTVYDMCKAVDRAMVIQKIRLREKSGGRSGSYSRAD